MRSNVRQAGFTLIEVSLAIVIGVVVLAGAVTLYNQTKRSAGDAKMKDKLFAVAGMVEELAATNFYYPDSNQMRTVYKSRRPDDYLLSPWGGTVGPYVSSPTNERGLDYWDQDLPANPQIGNPTHQIANGGVHAEGAVSYYRLTNGVAPVSSATASLYDKVKQQYVTYRGYCVHGISPENYTGWNVIGGK
ncbi:MAG TPA: prepilin-type N-terminal cleavage/methylation domain-containing protein [Stenomitos sp.]